MRFVPFSKVKETIAGKRAAVIGSGPSVLDNSPGAVERHGTIVRVNNYKLGPNQGYRTDVHYSFYGTSIRKPASQLKADGVKLCLCKCPNSKPIDSPWHEANGKQLGIDFRYIYLNRESWWFCDTFVPDDARFVSKYDLLDRHIPTTGFAAIIDILACKPKSLFVTGFDFFSSGVHNVNERWREGNTDDPIGHVPELELEWLAANRTKYPFIFDEKLSSMLEAVAA